ncbi:very short patch repair endonuclease [Pseudomonas sp. HS6]|uniref:very short patch repair endonuclease n=1 Tax=Pseudomonas sp. HS6 TaxID=2850559 RepID=UPI002189C855|nr:very short patch repair endonuclease [Pseudomonas sp. HS6]UQS18075.1 DNA mismatch endonuclease Vsr [Pseudomonas sp. HS6]
MDIVSPSTRSRMMSGIRAKNTKPELTIRRSLHKLGFRYKLHEKKLPGKPDLVLPKYNVVIFVHGCFWHGHNCPLFKWPKTRPEFWQKKIGRNRENDHLTEKKLLDNGWRVCKVWECAIRGNGITVSNVIVELSRWIRGGSSNLEISRASFTAEKVSNTPKNEGLQDEENTMDTARESNSPPPSMR